MSRGANFCRSLLCTAWKAVEYFCSYCLLPSAWSCRRDLIEKIAFINDCTTAGTPLALAGAEIICRFPYFASESWIPRITDRKGENIEMKNKTADKFAYTMVLKEMRLGSQQMLWLFRPKDVVVYWLGKELWHQKDFGWIQRTEIALYSCKHL